MELTTEGRFKVEVIADDSGTFAGNAIRFADTESAERYARDLYFRWTAVRQWRVVDTETNVIVAKGGY